MRGARAAGRAQRGAAVAERSHRAGGRGRMAGVKRGHLNVLEPDREDSCAQGDAGGCVGLKARAISTVRGLIARCAKRERQGERSAAKQRGVEAQGGWGRIAGELRARPCPRARPYLADPVTLTSRTGMTTVRASTMPAENAMRKARATGRAPPGEAVAKRSHRAGGRGEQWAHECPRARRRGSVA